MSTVLSARGVRKVFQGGDGRPLEILSGVDLDVGRGEFVAIVGESGAGKSTLLHLLGALDRPTEGTIILDNQRYDEVGETELDQLRNRRIGFVFQFHHLLRDFSALENVMMPMRIAGIAPEEARIRAGTLLAQVGLAERMSHRPQELSGGEQQRVAVARALANDPRLVLADEPSGNLDLRQAERLHDLLATLARDFETAMVVVTHNRQLASRADRVLAVDAGRLIPVDRVAVGE
ncbi:MAG TPA: ABC transporter ATP-binding protein [Gemmatimonadales bacterium]|nr:ABC transporter ATP-binding protein [Gemmatimonadales bacterium]